MRGAGEDEPPGAERASMSCALASRLRLSTIRLGRELRRHDPSEFSIAQRLALTSVVRTGPFGVGELAEIEGLPTPAVTWLTDRLEEAGPVVRHAHPTDRRGVLVVAMALSTPPPLGCLFAAFLGYNPPKDLLGPAVLAHLAARQTAAITSRAFSPGSSAPRRSTRSSSSSPSPRR